MSKKTKTQVEKFRDAARAHEADESEGAFNAALKAIATNKTWNHRSSALPTN
jgi:hypothetical protein